MSKKKSSQGKGNGASAKGGGMKQQFARGTPTVRRPPRHQGR
jgi:hypothetical protein